MAHFGTLRDFKFHETDVDDIRGADLYDRDDDKIGEIKDIIFDHHSGDIRYAVVDCGSMMRSRKVIVPADRIHSRRGHDDDFAVDLSRDQLANFPPFEDKHLDNDRDWHDFESRNEKAWETGPVLHKENSTHAITPEPEEMPAPTGSGTDDINLEPARIAGLFTDTAPNSGKTRLRPSGIASRAEDTNRPGEAFGNESANWERSDIQEEREEMGQHRHDQLRDDSDIGYGDVDRTVVRGVNTNELPPSYRDTVDGQHDEIDLHRPYPVQEGRHRRFEAFENHLRRNRVDITSSCRSCDVERDKAA